MVLLKAVNCVMIESGLKKRAYKLVRSKPIHPIYANALTFLADVKFDTTECLSFTRRADLGGTSLNCNQVLIISNLS